MGARSSNRAPHGSSFARSSTDRLDRRIRSSCCIAPFATGYPPQGSELLATRAQTTMVTTARTMAPLRRIKAPVLPALILRTSTDRISDSATPGTVGSLEAATSESPRSMGSDRTTCTPSVLVTRIRDGSASWTSCGAGSVLGCQTAQAVSCAAIKRHITRRHMCGLIGRPRVESGPTVLPSQPPGRRTQALPTWLRSLCAPGSLIGLGILRARTVR